MEELLKSYRTIIGDLDNDGKEEKIVGYLQTVSMIKNENIVWRDVLAGVALVVRAHDINGDGKPEILMGGSERKLKVYDLEGNKIKEIQYWSPGDKRAGWIWDIIVDDVNGDGKPEILVGGMAAWGGGGIDVKLYDNEFNEIWTYHVNRSSFRLGVDDVDGDGNKEIIVTTFIGDVIILDKNGKVKHKTQVGAGVSAIEIASLNETGKKFILVGTVDGDLFVFNHKLKEFWKVKVSEYYPVQVYSIIAKDFNNDGKPEILVNCRRCVLLLSSNGDILYSKDNNILEFEYNGEKYKFQPYVEELALYKNGEQLWRINLPDRLEAATIVDINGDGKPEIVISLSYKKVVVINLKGEIIKELEVEDQTSMVEVADVNNDGKLELIVGTAFGGIYVYDLEGNKLSEHRLYGEIGTIGILDIDNDGKNELIAATKNQAGEILYVKY